MITAGAVLHCIDTRSVHGTPDARSILNYWPYKRVIKFSEAFKGESAVELTLYVTSPKARLADFAIALATALAMAPKSRNSVNNRPK